MKNCQIFLVLSIIFSCFTSEARWANEKDARVEYEFSNIDVKVHKDGGTETTCERKYTILTEDARDEQNYQLTYNGYSEKLEILEAYTIANGKKYHVKSDFIVDKVVSSVGQGFDETRKVTISFAKVERNSQIYLKFRLTCFKPPIEGFFNTMFYYSGEYFKASKMRVVSDLPLNIIINDPRKFLKVSHVKDAKTKSDRLEIDLIKPIIEYTIGYDRGILDSRRTTYVTVSSEKRWENLSARLAPPYYEVISQDLPEIFQDIFDSAEKAKNDVDRINIVTSKINEKIRYMGDWRTVKGQIFPNDLKRIAELQTGDCKDFSAVTGAILKKLGYKVQFALVWRGQHSRSFEQRLPVLFNTNHVILKVKSKNGKVFWIDPTNFVSMADGIFYDIEDKNALILESKGGKLEIVPKIDPNHARTSKIEEIRILDKPEDNIKIKTRVLFEGENAMFFTGMGLNYSEEYLKERVFGLVAGFPPSEINQTNIIIPDLKSTIVKDVELKVEFQSKKLNTYTNLGKGISLPCPYDIEAILKCDPSQIRDFSLGSASTFERTYIFRDKKIKNLETIAFDIQTKWLSFKRTAFYQGEDTVVKTKLVVYGGYIKNDELKTSEFKEFQTKLEKHVESFVIILN